jgi:hypothetical protein
VRFVWCYHWLHHRYCERNFNLLLGGDWLRRVSKRASPMDYTEMRRVGLPVE